MRQLSLFCIVVFALALVGCGGGSIVGTWKPDVNSIKIKADDSKMQAQLDQGLPQIKDSLAKMSVEFKADGTYTGTDPAGKTDSGKYTQSGNSVTMTPDKQQGATPPPVLTVSGNTMSAHIAQAGMSIDINFVKA